MGCGRMGCGRIRPSVNLRARPLNHLYGFSRLFARFVSGLRIRQPGALHPPACCRAPVGSPAASRRRLRGASLCASPARSATNAESSLRGFMTTSTTASYAPSAERRLTTIGTAGHVEESCRLLSSRLQGRRRKTNGETDLGDRGLDARTTWRAYCPDIEAPVMMHLRLEGRLFPKASPSPSAFSHQPG